MLRSLAPGLLLLVLVACTPEGVTRIDRDLSRSIESGELSGERLAEAYVDRGTARLLASDVPAALADYDAAIAAAPHYVPAYVWRGQAWDANADRRRASADFDYALTLDPKAWQAYGARGLMLARTGAVDRAMPDLGRAIELGRGHEGEALLQHVTTTPVQVQSAKGPPAFGTARAELTISADHYLSFIRDIRGGLLMERGRYADALADLDEAIRLNPASAHARLNRAMTLFALGRCPEGAEELGMISAMARVSVATLMSDERNRRFVAGTPCAAKAQ